MVGMDTVGMDAVEVDEVGRGQATLVLDAMTLIDEGLSKLQSRELVSANEVADLLLDVRTLLTASVAATDDTSDEKVPVSSN